MNKVYRSLALNSLSKNRTIYIPYIIASVSMYVLFYMILALSMDKYISMMPGGSAVQQILVIGCFVIVQVILIFLIDIRASVIKQRKKELGMYSVLGMEKKHVIRVNFLENLYVYLITVVSGTIIGVVLEKLFQVTILRVIGAEQDFSWSISLIPIIASILLFALVFAVLIMINSASIKRTNVLDYMKEEKKGDRKPKSNWLLALCGTLLLVGGYTISLNSDRAMDALFSFFIAVSLVILGTDLLFKAGSITILNSLRKNKNYYYKTSHFISVSGMLYRMKRNATSLATICIVSTMFLVTMSSVTCLYTSIGDTVDNWYCYDLVFEYQNTSEEEALADIDELAERFEVELDSMTEFKMIESFTEFNLPDSSADPIKSSLLQVYNNDAYDTYYFTSNQYKALTGVDYNLRENEIGIYSENFSIASDKIAPNGADLVFDLVELDSIPRVPHSAAITLSNGIVCLVFPSEEKMEEYFCYEPESASAEEYARCMTFDYYVCSSSSKAENQVNMTKTFVDEGHGYNCFGRYEARENIIGLYSGLFFLGLFMSMGFLVITVLTMYFRQLFEGYEDAAGFAIMRKVGLSKRDISKSINSQIVIVFFLPLVVAVIHTMFAFPMLKRLLRMFGDISVSKFMVVLAFVVLVFAVVYTISYLFTGHVYKKLVNGAYTERKKF